MLHLNSTSLVGQRPQQMSTDTIVGVSDSLIQPRENINTMRTTGNCMASTPSCEAVKVDLLINYPLYVSVSHNCCLPTRPHQCLIHVLNSHPSLRPSSQLLRCQPSSASSCLPRWRPGGAEQLRRALCASRRPCTPA